MEQEKESVVNYLSQDGAEGRAGGRLSRPHGGPDHIGQIKLLHSFGCFGDLGHLGGIFNSGSESSENPSTENHPKQTNQFFFSLRENLHSNPIRFLKCHRF